MRQKNSPLHQGWVRAPPTPLASPIYTSNLLLLSWAHLSSAPNKCRKPVQKKHFRHSAHFPRNVCRGERGTSEHGAGKCIRSQQCWGNYWLSMLKNARLFLVQPTIVQRIKLENACLRIGKKSPMICGLRALLICFLKHYFP